MPTFSPEYIIPERDAGGWCKGFVAWREYQTWYVSVPFTWNLPGVREWAKDKEEVCIGGPAAKLMPDYVREFAEVRLGDKKGILELHNPKATRTTKGCNNGCSFCGVSLIEGPFQEMDEWEPLPVVIDSNFLQCSDSHFDNAITKLTGVKGVDFNQGLEASRFKGSRAKSICSLRLSKLRFAWDSWGDKDDVLAAIDEARANGIHSSKISIYCLVNYGEEPAEALERMLILRELGVRQYPMRFQPLNSLKRNEYVSPEWEREDLSYFSWFWAKQVWLATAPFEWPSRGGTKLWNSKRRT